MTVMDLRPDSITQLPRADRRAGVASWQAFVVTFLLLGAAAPPPAARDCRIVRTIVIPAETKKGVPVDYPKHAYELADGSRLFIGKFTVDADGGPHAYHPDPGVGLDDTHNAGSPGNWYGLATESVDATGRANCGVASNPVVQDATDPAPGYYVSKTSMSNAGISDCRRQRRYVNAEIIPFVALPQAVGRVIRGQGPLTVVSRDGRDPQMALMADAAPRFGVGEGSIELARRLGYDPSPRRGGTGRRELVYLVLPQTAGYPANAAAVQTVASKAFEAWGGGERLDVCAAIIRKRPL